MNRFIYYKFAPVNNKGIDGWGIIRIRGQRFELISFDTNLIKMRQLYKDFMRNTEKVNRRIYD